VGNCLVMTLDGVEATGDWKQAYREWRGMVEAFLRQHREDVAEFSSELNKEADDLFRTRRNDRSKMERPTLKYDCFISYASEDRQLVQLLVDALARRSVKVWWDRLNIGIGDRLTRKIDEGLGQSRYGV